ncbi:ATP-binding cassette domain-containing protein [Catellatospora aurea]|uniref:ATP-binding cassette domain-containing protein n=1 Tax=Catellatospora aurea TaxID=1337874 RepID=A0ABW2H649_9ACTN
MPPLRPSTTTIRMLLGMVRPSAGTVTVLGQRLGPGTGTAVWAQVGYLVEAPSAYPDLTVRENLRIAARLHGLPGRGHVDEAIDRLGLAAYAGRKAGKLSLGNLQRLGLAKALLHRPRLLVLDEPANGLDPAGVVEIRALLRELADTGTAVLLSSHLLAEVARLADRVGVIHHGRLLRELDAAQLAAEQRRTLHVAARDNAAAAAALRAGGYRPRAVGGFVIFGVVTIWVFGREFSDRTAKDLLALPTSRTAVVTAKFVLITGWCLALTAQLYVLGLLIGAGLGLPGWSAAVAGEGLVRLLAVAAMGVVLTFPLALAACAGRGYLAAVGAMFLAVFCAQVIAALGYGHLFAWSVPALVSGVAGSEHVPVGTIGYLSVVLVGAAGALGTVGWWHRADH